MNPTITLLLLLFPFLAISNGGTVDVSHFRKTGNIKLLKTADVDLLREDLNLKIVGDFTEIDVVYTLKNNGEKQKMYYGFPVDMYRMGYLHDCYGLFSDDENCVKYFKAYLGDTKLKVNNWVDDSIYTANLVELNAYYHNDITRRIILRKWYTATIGFDKGETQTLHIKYKIKNTLHDNWGGFTYLYRYSDRHFTYHLTPSSNWGDGIVGEFNLSIDASELDSLGVVYKIDGIDGLKKDKGIYTFNTYNYDLKTKDRLEVHYDSKHIKRVEFMKNHPFPKQYIKSIRASENNATVGNLIDGDPKTTWEGKQGDWIEITFNKRRGKDNTFENVMPKAILALNGDYSSEENFNRSGKMDKVKVIVNDTIIYYEGSFDNPRTGIVKLEKPGFKNIAPEMLSGFSGIIAEGQPFYFLIKIRKNQHDKAHYKVRIKILKVDGNDGDKCRLSEIYQVWDNH